LALRTSENPLHPNFREHPTREVVRRIHISRTRVNRGKKGRACYTPARIPRPSHVGAEYVGGRVGVYVVDRSLIERLLE
jgi:hypothetical protein